MAAEAALRTIVGLLCLKHYTSHVLTLPPSDCPIHPPGADTATRGAFSNEWRLRHISRLALTPLLLQLRLAICQARASPVFAPCPLPLPHRSACILSNIASLCHGLGLLQSTRRKYSGGVHVHRVCHADLLASKHTRLQTAASRLLQLQRTPLSGSPELLQQLPSPLRQRQQQQWRWRWWQ